MIKGWLGIVRFWVSNVGPGFTICAIGGRRRRYRQKWGQSSLTGRDGWQRRRKKMKDVDKATGPVKRK